VTLTFDPKVLDSIPDQDLWDIYESIRDGAKTPAESLGFDEAALISIERMALGYYRANRFGAAAVIYGFILRLSQSRSSAWRGLGACAQAMREFELASKAFKQALETAPDDAITKVFLGECLCQLGERDEGLKLLSAVVDGAAKGGKGVKDTAVAPYVTRARAIIQAKGGVPNRIVLKRAGQSLVQEVDALFSHIDFTEPPLEFDDNREIMWDDIKRNPQLMKMIGDLKAAVNEGRLTLAEVGGFTDNELDGAYAVACKYAEMGQVAPAMQITGYLIFIDPYKARYYQLVGICMQRLGQYATADHYYGMASAMAPDDPMTKIYRGEAKIMSGKKDDGLGLVRDGLALAQSDPAAHKALIDRAKVLIKQFSS
jgi:tetratricopeptide (TPR) repeat protein